MMRRYSNIISRLQPIILILSCLLNGVASHADIDPLTRSTREAFEIIIGGGSPIIGT
ncbi:hypothetical protein TIFTF001_007042, partial [Ficus carica]